MKKKKYYLLQIIIYQHNYNTSTLRFPGIMRSKSYKDNGYARTIADCERSATLSSQIAEARIAKTRSPWYRRTYTRPSRPVQSTLAFLPSRRDRQSCSSRFLSSRSALIPLREAMGRPFPCPRVADGFEKFHGD